MMRRTLRAAGLLAIMILSLNAAPAAALDDGGGRSVFARGAGERALALGGAYAAVASDAEAMIWNPAGLAGVQRKSVYASHSDLIGLGFSEQLGLLALPSWKLGTVGLGLRRFGVDGIEGRDDRGAIFDDNLQDAETEILLGYGRRVGGIWDFGLVFKYQQQSLAGYSDGAPGLDLGVKVKPLQAAGKHSDLADALSLGFAIRNLIEPNLKLDEDGVKDPTGLRLGVAYEGKLSRNIDLLLASDMEKTSDMDLRIHAGAEVRLMDILALRVGSHAGMMTAGAGVNYRNLAVDYAFEDNLLETVHRFGLGVSFGPTTTESRQTSLTAQEAELQKQLARAFEKENSDRVATMVGQARRALADSDHTEALRIVETVRVLAPGYPGLTAVEADAYYRQGLAMEEKGNLSGAAVAFQRCLVSNPDNAEADAGLSRVLSRSSQLAARTEVIRARFDGALEAYARGDFVQARSGFEQVVELQPGDKEAIALLQNTIQAMQLKADLLLDQSSAQITANEFVAARDNLAKARVLVPDHGGLAGAEARLATQERAVAAATEAKRNGDRATAAAPVAQASAPVVPALPTYAALSAQEQQEVADLYQRGLQAIENGSHADAVRYWELVWSRAPDYQQVGENLKQEYLVQGMEAFAGGRLDQSIEIWERADEVAPGDPRTNGYLNRAYEHKSRIREIQGDH
jgi:tetratricopeptide (TPR) repeat protein